MSLPYLLPPQFLLPSWNFCQLVSRAQTAHFPNRNPWKKSTLKENRRRNYLTKIRSYNKLPNFHLILIARLHSGFPILSFEKIEDSRATTSGVKDQVESDDRIGDGAENLSTNFPKVQYVISERQYPEIRRVTVSPKINNQLSQENSSSFELHISKLNSIQQCEEEPTNPKAASQSHLFHADDQLIKESGGDLQNLSDSNVFQDSKSQPQWVLKKRFSSKNDSTKNTSKSAYNRNSFNNSTKAVQKNSVSKSSVLSEKNSFSNNNLMSNSDATSGLSEESDSKSLFDELFPEELIKQEKARQRRAVVNVETLPIFNWTPMKYNRRNSSQQSFNSLYGIKKESKSEMAITTATTTTNEQRNGTEYYDFHQNTSTLCLSGCSTSLEESDFFRLGSKGEHIEAWTNGIIKVIPIRNEVTLRCVGSYLILFATENSARDYLKQILRLHKLSRIKNNAESSMLPVTTEDLHEGEDLEALLKGFSLVPGYGRLTIKLLRRPYKPRYSQILRNGGPLGILKHKFLTENLVLFYLDVGNISIGDLLDFLNHDGKRRNLPWKLAGGYDAILETNKYEDPENKMLVKDAREKKQWQRPSSYVLPFAGEYEARRFVKEWHRRQFPLRQQNQSNHDNHISIINAELMW